MGEKNIDRNISTLQFQKRILSMAESFINIPQMEKLNYANIVYKNLMEFNSIRLPEVQESDIVDILINDYEIPLLNSITDIYCAAYTEMYNESFSVYMRSKSSQVTNSVNIKDDDIIKGRGYLDVEPFLEEDMIYLYIKPREDDDLFYLIEIPNDSILINSQINVILNKIFSVHFDDINWMKNMHKVCLMRFVRDKSLEFNYKTNNPLEYAESLSVLLEGKQTNDIFQAFVFDVLAIHGYDDKSYYNEEDDLFSTDIKCINVSTMALLGIDFVYKFYSSYYDKDDVTNSSLYFDDFIPSEYPSDFDFISELNDTDTIDKSSDIIVRHPYDSYDYVVNYIKQMCENPRTKFIFITLYRVSSSSVIVDSLCDAAKSGKNVYVYTEVMARGDEENNIALGKLLTSAGVHIQNHHTDFLKVHMKAFVAVTDNGETYSLISTGNFHEITGNLYTDISYITKNINVGIELLGNFKHLFNIGNAPNWGSFVISQNIRSYIINKINEQIMLGEKGRIFIKVNHLCDTEIVNALNDAVANNVNVKLLVRTGMDYSILKYVEPVNYPNIQVRSRVGRFLEHDRLFIFGDDVYIGSCDMLSRNLDKRVEILFKIPSIVQSKNLVSLFRSVFNYKKGCMNCIEPSGLFSIGIKDDTCIRPDLGISGFNGSEWYAFKK